MSLFIYVSPKSVIIQKYRLEFPFTPPPEPLTKAAMGAYQLLRQSVSIQTGSSREERDEVMTLLRHYGAALFHAVIPKQLRQTIYKEGGIFVFAMDRELIKIPWELLYDGKAFFGLTQGLIRVNYANGNLLVTDNNLQNTALKVSLNAYTPRMDHLTENHLADFPAGYRFISRVEELHTSKLIQSPRVVCQTNDNADVHSIMRTIEKVPNIFLFSGYDSKDGWLLSGDSASNETLSWFNAGFQKNFSHALKNGLRIVFLITSDLLEDNGKLINDPLSRYFDMGVPYMVTVHGRIARHRFQEYFQTFVLSLAREDGILKAHRHAVNALQSSLPLSWDWSWIQLHINKNRLENSQEPPLTPFRFELEPQAESPKPDHPFMPFSTHRRFSGCHEALGKIERAMNNRFSNQIITLLSQNGQAIESYICEFFRRIDYFSNPR